MIYSILRVLSMSNITDFKTRLFSLTDDQDSVELNTAIVQEYRDLHQVPLMADLPTRMRFYRDYGIPMLHEFIKTGQVNMLEHKRKLKDSTNYQIKKWNTIDELSIARSIEEVDKLMSMKGRKAILFIPTDIRLSTAHPLALQLHAPAVDVKFLRMSKKAKDYAYRLSQLSLNSISLILEEYKVIDDNLHELTVGMLQETVNVLAAEYGEVFVNFIPERGAEIWCRTGDTALRILQWASMNGVACNGDISMVTWLDQCRSGLLISISNMNQNIGLALGSKDFNTSAFFKHLLSNYSGIKKGQRMHKWFKKQFVKACDKYQALKNK